MVAVLFDWGVGVSMPPWRPCPLCGAPSAPWDHTCPPSTNTFRGILGDPELMRPQPRVVTWPCSACGATRRVGRRHLIVACWWRCWRYYRRTGLTPLNRWFLERVAKLPPEQVAVFVEEPDQRGQG